MCRCVLALPALALLSAVASTPRPAPASPRAAADTTTITIRSTSAALAFEPDQFTVKAGTTVRIRYINESVMAHNFVIVRTGDDIDVLGAAAYEAGATGFVPMQHKDRMVAYSPLASAGKTVEVTFVAPPPGEYPFVCLVDGHFNVMLGTMRSRP
jgi:plastocyanin